MRCLDTMMVTRVLGYVTRRCASEPVKPMKCLASFSRNARLDQNQVELYAVQVNRPSAQAWEATLPPGTTSSTVQLRPDTCIEYGQPVASFETRVPPRALEPGIYEVLLQAGDQKRRRAWFYKRFCLVRSAGNWSVRNAERLEGTHEWRCSPPQTP